MYYNNYYLVILYLFKKVIYCIMLKVFYITNDPLVAKIAEKYGVDRIFVDMEYIGKNERQQGMDTVKNHHTVEDVKNIRSVLKTAQLLVRVNPIHPESEKEINDVIRVGADVIMLPMFKTADEVRQFISYVDNRAKAMLLLENIDAVHCLDEILKIDGIDEIHIGLNDLHLSMQKKFLFELLADSTVEQIVEKIAKTKIPYGFGGFGKIGEGTLPAEYIVCEHYRLGSSMGILSRAFCNTTVNRDYENIESIFKEGMQKLRSYESFLKNCDESYFNTTHRKLCECVKNIVGEM